MRERAAGADRLQVLLVGVGGQGVLTAARILGEAAHDTGLPVVVGQLHGMAQRGGSVQCSVLIGPGQSSFLTRTDVLVGFEPLEVLRACNRMSEQTRGLVNRGQVMLPDRRGRAVPAPEQILDDIRAVSPRLIEVDGPAAVQQIGVARTLNAFLLGALAGLELLPIDEARLWDAVASRCGRRYEEANHQAFALGRLETAGQAPRPAQTQHSSESRERP